MALGSHFLLAVLVGPRDFQMACQLVAEVGWCLQASGASLPLPLFLMDDHRPYPGALLQVFGVVKHRRRRRQRGRRKKPGLKAPPGLLAGVVQKVRDGAGRVVKVRRRALFGTLRQITERLAELGLGRVINTAHLERLNGTARGQQCRLSRRTRQSTKQIPVLVWFLLLWRDFQNWIWPHSSLGGKTPAMALRLTDHVWSAWKCDRYPVHVDSLMREIWKEQLQELLTPATERRKRRKALPTS